MNPSRRVRLQLKPCAKGIAAKFGERVYKFYRGNCGLLKARGWVEVKQTKEYSYLQAPETETSGPPFVIEAALPTREQVMAIAESVHARGQPWSGSVGEWGAWYSPPTTAHISKVDPFTGIRDEAVQHIPIEPHFWVGDSSVWSAAVYWQAGVPRYAEHAENILPSGRTQLSLFQSSDLFEGALRRVEVNEYERNETARRLCIAHHGAVCAVCGFDFAKCYGAAAEGFIEVHHVIPISQVGGEYEVDPVNDLIPVCPNCHAVIHLRNPPYSIVEVKAFIEQGRYANAHRQGDRDCTD